MLRQFLTIFVDVVTPVFGLVLISYLAGPRLELKVRTLSRTAYFLFIPAFVFDIISKADIEAVLAVRMIAYISLVHILLAAVALGIGKIMQRPREVIGAYILIAAFANTGNFGLSLIDFRLGHEGLAPATVYFLGLNIVNFTIGVGAASWSRGRGGWQSVLSVFKTPAIIAVLPALLVNLAEVPVPLFLSRLIGLLSQAMIPTMLVTLGVQLADAGRPQINRDICTASAVRLIGGPLVAMLLILPFGLTGLERATGILQSSMPAAVLTAVIAIEYDMVPEMVTHTVLFSTVVSFFTLTVIMSLL